MRFTQVLKKKQKLSPNDPTHSNYPWEPFGALVYFTFQWNPCSRGNITEDSQVIRTFHTTGRVEIFYTNVHTCVSEVKVSHNNILRDEHWYSILFHLKKLI